MKNHRRIALAFILLAAGIAGAQDTNFAFRLPCELQTAGAASLIPLTWQQGTTPHIAVTVLRQGRAVAADPLTTVSMKIGSSPISTNFVPVTNWLATNDAYYVQFPTVGTNSAGTNSEAQAWWYTVHFERDGRRYWTGDGRLYIEPTTSTAEDGLAWQEITAGAATDLVARAQIQALSNVVEGIEVGSVSYGVLTNSAYRGDWGHSVSGRVDSVSNLARTAQTAATNAQGVASNAAAVAAAALPASGTNAVIAEARTGLVETNHSGGVRIDGQLNVHRNSFSTNYEDGDTTFRAWNNGQAEFTVDTRSENRPTFMLESGCGYTFFSHRCDSGNNNADLWMTTTDQYDDNFSNLVSRVHLNPISEYIDFTDVAENKSYRLLMGGSRDVYGGYTNETWRRLWSNEEDGTNVWQGRVNDTESTRIAALASGAGISAATATGISYAVIGAAPASAFSNVTFGATATVMCATGTWYDAATRTAYTTSCPSGTGGGSTASAAGEQGVYALSGTNLTISPTNLQIQSFTATSNYQVVMGAKTNLADSATIQWEVTSGQFSVNFITNSPVVAGYIAPFTNKQTVYLFRCPSGTSNWLSRILP